MVEYGKDGWVSTGGVAPFSWRFSVRMVLASARSGILISLVWVKSTVGRMMASISPSETLCIISRYLLCTPRYGVLADLVDEFLVDSTYSEFPPLPPKLDVDVKSLSGLAGDLGDSF